MRGLTIGIGTYRETAERAAASVRRYAGFEVDVVTECPQTIHPSAYRLWLVLGYSEPVFWFDADTLMLRPWGVGPDAVLNSFAAVLDRPGFGQDEECRTYGIDPARYFNAGVAVIHPEAHSAIEYARDMVTRPEYSSRFQEQTALNVGIQRCGTSVSWLDGRYNHFANEPLPDDVVIIHGAGPNRAAFERLAQQLWRD